MLKKLENFLQAEIDPVFAKRAAYILNEVERKNPEKILDAGCGRGFYLKAISLYNSPKEICGIDINPSYLEKAKKLCAGDKRVKIAQASIYTLSYPNSYFDFIICSEILEHLTGDEKALSELNRVLKPGGSLVITVPHHNFPFFWDPLNWLLMRLFHTHVNKDVWWLAGIWADHLRLYKEEGLVKLIKKTGYEVRDKERIIRYSWPFSHFLLYGIGKNIVERLGGKQFDRFSFEKKPLANILSSVFAFPSRFDSNSQNIYVNLALVCDKEKINKA